VLAEGARRNPSIGNVLLNILATHPTETQSQKLYAARLGTRIAEAMEEDRTLALNETQIALLRAAVKQAPRQMPSLHPLSYEHAMRAVGIEDVALDDTA